MGRFAQKSGVCLHGLEDATPILTPKSVGDDIRLISHLAHQGFGVMDVDVVRQRAPLGHHGVGGNQALDMVDKVFFFAPAPVGRLDDLATRDIEV